LRRDYQSSWRNLACTSTAFSFQNVWGSDAQRSTMEKGDTVPMLRHRDRRRSLALGGLRGVALMVIAAIAVAVLAPAAQAAPRTVWVEPAGHTLDGLFLDAWRANATYLGMPISEEFKAKVPVDKKTEELTVQYFENLALAYSPDDPRGDDWTVFALSLGSEALKRDKAKLKSVDLSKKGSCGQLPSESCRLFDETGHTLRWGFKIFWEANGGEQMIGLPLTEDFAAADGWTTQYFERAVLLWKKNENVKPKAIGKDIAKHQKIETQKVNQPLDIPVYDELLFQEPTMGVGGIGSGPGPIQGGDKEIVISVSQQTLWAYENGVIVAATLVSTGTGNVTETITPTGYFSILTKYLSQTMEGTIAGEHYNVPDVPWVMYFDNAGNAIHGAYWHNNFGTPMSHGCVNLPLDVAEFLFGWAPEGTPVTVID
jgi:lipoprotein-anchoring transpeptidase ErfK/SrfK